MNVIRPGSIELKIVSLFEPSIFFNQEELQENSRGVHMAEILSLDDVKDATVLIKKILNKKGHVVHCFFQVDITLVPSYLVFYDLTDF